MKKNVAVISGGSSGIGLAVAEKLASLSYDVVICARDSVRLKQSEDQIRSVAPHAKVGSYPCDVTDELSCRKLFEYVKNNFGYVDIALNCAGLARPDYFQNINYEKFDKVIQTNLYGTRNFCFAALDFLNPEKSVLVNCSSLAGLVSVFGYTDYCASKAGIIGFSDALRQELKSKNVCVKVLCPPDTDTYGFEMENKTKPYQTSAISAGAKLRSADSVADYLIKNIKNKKFLIIPGIESRLTWGLKRFFPGVLENIMSGIVRREEKKHEKNN
ncbi:MAG: SDR family NAD(P)-dependent oxidoreductase [Spirochaetales bacterium]|nr:SDR family NAD(P)-dependent oxidoreductase [Spirochaetales bacterium]